MIQPPGLAADRALRLMHGIDQGFGVVRVGRTEAQLALECLPGRAARLGQAVLGDGGLGVRAELMIGHGELRGSRADDPVSLGQQVGFGKVEEPREQLAPGKVSGRAEQDNDMVVWEQAGPVIAGVHNAHSFMDT